MRYVMTLVMAFGILFTGAPVALAAPSTTAVTTTVGDRDHDRRDRCRPEHRGDRWRWHETRGRDHWDYRDDGRWEHRRWDDRYCDNDRRDRRDRHDRDRHDDRHDRHDNRR